jgi:DNA-binding XRE family transcriptional regulator
MVTKRKSKTELKQLKSWAQTLITREKLTQKEAAERVGVTPATMNSWYREGKWENLKKNILLTREEQMLLNTYIANKKEGYQWADSKEANIRRYLVKDIKDLETKAALPEIIHACTRLLEFVRKVDLTKAQELSRYIDGFIKSKL